MDVKAVLARYDRLMRRDAPPDGTDSRIERVGDVVRQVGADVAWNGWTGVIWSDLDADTADAAIEAQIEYFTARGREFEWKLYAHDQPDDLGARLEAAGFTPEPEEALMAAEAAGLAGEAELPDGVRLFQVTDAAGLEFVIDVHERAFGESATWLRDQLRAQLADPAERVVVVVAMAGDVPVSAARLEMLAGVPFAGLWGGGTVPEWRGRGLYRALIAFRSRIAAARGYPYVQVDASSESRPILHRLGFAALSTTTPYVYRP